VAAILDIFWSRVAALFRMMERLGTAMAQKEIQISDIHATRRAMSEKIDMLANRLHSIVAGPKRAVDTCLENLRQAKQAIEASASVTAHNGTPVHRAVAETIEQTKACLHLSKGVDQDPWMMLGSALLMGYILGSSRDGKSSTGRRAHAEVKRSLALHSSTSSAPSS
jgi:hypothetical protein